MDDHYLGFYANDNGVGEALATGLLDYLDSLGLDYKESLVVIGCDSTSANTGYKVRK